MNIIFFIKNWLKAFYDQNNLPKNLQIGITTKCNLQCIMCRNYKIEKGKDMSFGFFKTVIDQLPKLKMLCMAGLGENLLNKDFLAMISYAKSKNIHVSSFSNFSFIDRPMANKLIDTGLDEIFASVDGATKETYEKIRPGSNFERVIDNIKNLSLAKKEKKANVPVINFNYTINEYNKAELLPFVKMIGNLTNGEKTVIQFKRLIDGQGEDKKPYYIEIPPETIAQTNQAAKNMNIELMWENIPKDKKTSLRCKQWLRPMITPDGRFIPCCFSKTQNEYFENLHIKSFKQIWQSKNYKNFRKMITKGVIPSVCKSCGRYYLDKMFF